MKNQTGNGKLNEKLIMLFEVCLTGALNSQFEKQFTQTMKFFNWNEHIQKKKGKIGGDRA